MNLRADKFEGQQKTLSNKVLIEAAVNRAEKLDQRDLEGEKGKRDNMAGSALTSGDAQMQDSLEYLRVNWEQVRNDWNDVVSRKLGEDFVEPLEEQLRRTLEAVQVFSGVLNGAIRQCSDEKGGH